MKQRLLILLTVLLLLASSTSAQAALGPRESISKGSAASGALHSPSFAFLDFETSSNRTKAMQIAALGMALALFIVMRNKH